MNMLEEAILKGDLKLYLVSHYLYSYKDHCGCDVMNDFYAISCELNSYATGNIAFVMDLHETIMDILDENKIYYTYSIINIIAEHLYLTEKKSNSFDYDVAVIKKIKNNIFTQKQILCSEKSYDGIFYDDGLLGVYKRLNAKISDHYKISIV